MERVFPIDTTGFKFTPLIRDSCVPLYRQLVDQIREAVQDKSFNPKDPLPKEVDIAEYLGISRSVVRQAILQLVAEGFLTRIPGKGTFLAAPIPIVEYDILGFYNFKKEVERQGQELSIRLVSFERLPMDPINSGLFQAGQDDHIIEIWRTLSVNNMPVILERTTILESLVPGITADDVKDIPYLTLFQKYGITITKAKKYIEPRLSDPFISQELEIKTGMPVLNIDRYTYGPDEKSVVARSVWTIRGDRCRHYLSLESRNL